MERSLFSVLPRAGDFSIPWLRHSSRNDGVVVFRHSSRNDGVLVFRHSSRNDGVLVFRESTEQGLFI
jgi:hypothetical protein